MTLLDMCATETEDSSVIIMSLLEETDLLRKILDTATKEGSKYTLQSTGLSLARGYMPFVRLWANKLVQIQKKNEEVANMLESIPEWSDYCENELQKYNEVESRQLG